MQLKQNDRGLYLFFPTGAADLQASAYEMATLTELTAYAGTMDIYKVIWMANNDLQNKLRAARKAD
jgi:hypothetical protein